MHRLPISYVISEEKIKSSANFTERHEHQKPNKFITDKCIDKLADFQRKQSFTGCPKATKRLKFRSKYPHARGMTPALSSFEISVAYDKRSHMMCHFKILTVLTDSKYHTTIY